MQKRETEYFIYQVSKGENGWVGSVNSKLKKTDVKTFMFGNMKSKAKDWFEACGGTWVEGEVCPKCGTTPLKGNGRDALSRKTNEPICASCGIIEALDEAKEAGLI